MKTLYTGKILRINYPDGLYNSIIPFPDFDNIIKLGYTRKKAKELGIGSRLWNNSYKHHYPGSEGEKLRVERIKNTNSINRNDIWESYLSRMEPISPGITKIFRDNLRNNPEIINKELSNLNDLFYETKEFIHITKKWIRQSCIRKGLPHIKLVGNLCEYKLKRLLLSLGYTVTIQPYINKHWFDFGIGNILIELDGPQYHGGEKDIFKEKLAIDNGYKLVRIKTEELKNEKILRLKLLSCLEIVK